jgi:ribose transport system permease protein
MIICIIIAYIIFNNTTVGINIRATGCNEQVSKTMGINVSKTLILGGVIAGAFLGIAGVVKESVSIFTPAQGGLTSLSTVFQPLAAVLLAKTLSKFINRMIAVPISTFIIVLIFNVLTLLGVPSGTFQEFLLGSVVIIFSIFAQRGVKGVVK